MNTELRRRLQISIQRTKRNFIIVLFILAGLLAMMFAAVFYDPERTLFTQVAVSLLALGVVYLMLKMAKIAFKPNPLLEILEHQPSQIKTVEVISIVYQNGRPSFQMNLHFHTADGRRLVLSENRSSIEALLPLLRAQLPHAEFREASQR